MNSLEENIIECIKRCQSNIQFNCLILYSESVNGSYKFNIIQKILDDLIILNIVHNDRNKDNLTLVFDNGSELTVMIPWSWRSGQYNYILVDEDLSKHEKEYGEVRYFIYNDENNNKYYNWRNDFKTIKILEV